MPDAIPSTALGRPPPTLGDLALACWRRRVVALIVGTLVAAVAISVVWTRKPVYEATARLLCSEDSKTVDFQRQGEGLREFALINTYREMLLSSQMLKRALEDCGAIHDEPFANQPDPGDLLRRNLRVSVNRDSWLITVDLADGDPARAERLLRAVLGRFLDSLGGQRRTSHAEALRYLTEQVGEARTRLDGARQREQEFRQLNALIANNPQENHIYQRVLDLTKQRSEMDRLLAEAQAQVEQIATARRQPVGPNGIPDALLGISTIGSDKLIGEHLLGITALREKRAQLAEKYGPKHPRMQEVEAQISDRCRGLIQVVDQVCSAQQSILTRLRTQSAELDDQMHEAESAARSYRDNLAKLAAIETETRSHEEVLRHLVARLAEQQATTNLTENRISIADPPSASPRAVGLSRSILLIIALLGGAAAGAVAALVAELTDRHIRNPGDLLDAVGRPVLGEIPPTDPLPSPAMQVAAPAFAESFRRLRTSLAFLRSPDRTCEVLLVCSSSEGDGGSTVAAHLAATMAAVGERVLLVDGNLRTPAQHLLIGMVSGHGLSLLLAGEPGISPVDSGIPGLHLLDAGPQPPNPAELLTSHCLGEWLTEMRELYDVVVVDCPPLSQCSDALVLGEQADHLLLVTRRGQTTRAAITTALGTLQPLGPRLAGSILVG